MSKEHGHWAKSFSKEFLFHIQLGNGVIFIESLREKNILSFFLPEIYRCIGCDGGILHNEDIYSHLIGALQYANENNYHYYLKLACLLHDIGKPDTYSNTVEGIHFHGHELVGAKIAYSLCKRLGLEHEGCKYVSSMVRRHMFFWSMEASEKAYRRWLFKTGKNWKDLFLIRAADRAANKAKKGKDCWSEKMIEQVDLLQDIISKSAAIFIEDIQVSPSIIGSIDTKYGDKESIYSNLIGLINDKPERNNSIWLEDYIKRVYPDVRETI